MWKLIGWRELFILQVSWILSISLRTTEPIKLSTSLRSNRSWNFKNSDRSGVECWEQSQSQTNLLGTKSNISLILVFLVVVMKEIRLFWEHNCTRLKFSKFGCIPPLLLSNLLFLLAQDVVACDLARFGCLNNHSTIK